MTFDQGSTDDGKRSEAEWTLYDDGIEERGVPGGEGTAALPGRTPADRLKMVPKMEVHFYMIRVPFWGFKMV